MSTAGSLAAAASTERGKVTLWESTKHRPELRGVSWELVKMHSFTGNPYLVVELTAGVPAETTHATQDGGELPAFLQEAVEAAERAASASTPVPAPSSNIPRKLLYAEALAAGRPDLTDAEYRLLMAMWKYANNRTLGDVRPGHSTLAEQVGLSGKSGREKVRVRIGSLIRKGYVVKLREGRTVPTRQAAEYRLTLPEWERDSPS